jgi:hypothetical protein
MSDTQLLFIRHWLRKGKEDGMKRLGGLLGVYWTSENYNPNNRGNDSEPRDRLTEMWVPMLSALAPEVMDKTLKSNLKTRSEVVHDKAPTRTLDGDEYDMSQVPANDYMNLWKQGEEPRPIDGLPPLPTEPQEERAIKPLAEPLKAKTPQGLDVTFDLDEIAKLDPELAKHLDPNTSW